MLYHCCLVWAMEVAVAYSILMAVVFFVHSAGRTGLEGCKRKH